MVILIEKLIEIFGKHLLCLKKKSRYLMLSFNGQDKQAGINIGIKYWSSVEGVKGRMLSNLILWKTN